MYKEVQSEFLLDDLSSQCTVKVPLYNTHQGHCMTSYVLISKDSFTAPVDLLYSFGLDLVQKAQHAIIIYLETQYVGF